MAVVAEGLRKQYGDAVALNGIDLTVPKGTVCGLLGANGAGKTTAVRILSTLLRLDGGRAQVAGIDVVRQGAATSGSSARTRPSTRSSVDGRTW
jgi:ABC-2 type transport system ATP-binding protein